MRRRLESVLFSLACVEGTGVGNQWYNDKKIATTEIRKEARGREEKRSHSVQAKAPLGSSHDGGELRGCEARDIR